MTKKTKHPKLKNRNNLLWTLYRYIKFQLSYSKTDVKVFLAFYIAFQIFTIIAITTIIKTDFFGILALEATLLMLIPQAIAGAMLGIGIEKFFNNKTYLKIFNKYGEKQWIMKV